MMQKIIRAVLPLHSLFGSLLSPTNAKPSQRMKPEAPSIFINDDEVEFKVIYVYSKKSNKIRKYTLSAAERLGFIGIDCGSFQMGRGRYSKAITIKNRNVNLCLATKVANSSYPI